MQSASTRSNLRVTKIIPFKDAFKISWWHRFNVFELYMWSNIIFMAFGCYTMVHTFWDLLWLADRSSNISGFLLAVVAAFLILLLVVMIFHEGLHFLAYRSFGINDANLQCRWTGIQCCVPNRLVGARETIIALLAPTVLSLILLAGCFLAQTAEMRLIAGTALFMNAFGAGWDWFLAVMTLRDSSIAFWEDDVVRKEMIGYSQI